MSLIRTGAKWPAFEEVFEKFEPRRVRAMSDEALEALLGDRRLIRHWGKLKSVRDNAAAMINIAEEHGSFGAWLADWPGSDIVELWETLAKRFSQMGGNSGSTFLRMVGGPTGQINGPFTVTANPPGTSAALALRTFRIGFPIQQVGGFYSLVLDSTIKSMAGDLVDANLGRPVQEQALAHLAQRAGEEPDRLQLVAHLLWTEPQGLATIFQDTIDLGSDLLYEDLVLPHVAEHERGTGDERFEAVRAVGCLLAVVWLE